MNIQEKLKIKVDALTTVQKHIEGMYLFPLHIETSYKGKDVWSFKVYEEDFENKHIMLNQFEGKVYSDHVNFKEVYV